MPSSLKLNLRWQLYGCGLAHLESTEPEIKTLRVQHPLGAQEILEFFQVKKDVLTHYWRCINVYMHALKDQV